MPNNTSQDVPDFERAFDDFIHRFECAFDAARDTLCKDFEDSLSVVMRRHLKIPKIERDESINDLLEMWAVFGPSLWGSDRRQALVDEIRDSGAREVADVFAELGAGRLAAWDLKIDGQAYAAFAVDGSDLDKNIEVQAVTDRQWEDLWDDPAQATPCIGWLVKVGSSHAVIGAIPLSEALVDRLQSAARRNPWTRGNTFRARAYTEDLLVCALHPKATDTECAFDPVFLDPKRINDAQWIRNGLWEGLQAQLQRFGLPSLYPGDAPIYPYRPKPDGPTYTSSLAAADEPNLQALFDDIERARQRLLRHQFYWDRTMGPRLLAHMLPDRSILSDFRLRLDGSVDHQRPENLGRYPLSATGLATDWIRRHHLQPDWSIDQTKAWADRRLDEPACNRLHRAIADFNVALRWTALVDLHTQRPPTLLGPPDYNDLLCGLHNHLPGAVLATPLSRLDPSKAAAWDRVTSGLIHTEQLAEGHSATLGNLPRRFNDLEVLPGVGKKTRQILFASLSKFISGWPDTAGHRLVDAHRSDRAASEIAAGLDELDQLF